MNVLLLKHTQDPELVVAQAGKLCYSAVGVNEIAQQLTPAKTEAFIKKLIELGHFSALEHAVFTFAVEGVSRALTHQLVRHRLASYSQQSQRYVSMHDFPYVTPPSLEANPALKTRYQEVMQRLGADYEALLEAGVPAEDARYLLPNACETKMVITMNARELHHFFRLRCCNRAQWEIHAMADLMLKTVKAVAPGLFVGAGPGCVAGPCPEGSMTCGEARDVKAKYQAL